MWWRLLQLTEKQLSGLQFVCQIESDGCAHWRALFALYQLMYSGSWKCPVKQSPELLSQVWYWESESRWVTSMFHRLPHDVAEDHIGDRRWGYWRRDGDGSTASISWPRLRTMTPSTVVEGPKRSAQIPIQCLLQQVWGNTYDCGHLISELTQISCLSLVEKCVALPLPIEHLFGCRKCFFLE